MDDGVCLVRSAVVAAGKSRDVGVKVGGLEVAAAVPLVIGNGACGNRGLTTGCATGIACGSYVFAVQCRRRTDSGTQNQKPAEVTRRLGKHIIFS